MIINGVVCRLDDDWLIIKNRCHILVWMIGGKRICSSPAVGEVTLNHLFLCGIKFTREDQ